MSNMVNFPNSTSGNVFFYNNVTADAFQTSDTRLKDHQEPITAEEALGILTAVTPKKYERNDKGGEKRHGLIAQELKAACANSEHFACLVGSAGDEGEDSILAIDYARLSAVLWTCVKDLHLRLEVLENAKS